MKTLALSLFGLSIVGAAGYVGMSHLGYAPNPLDPENAIDVTQSTIIISVADEVIEQNAIAQLKEGKDILDGDDQTLILSNGQVELLDDKVLLKFDYDLSAKICQSLPIGGQFCGPQITDVGSIETQVLFEVKDWAIQARIDEDFGIKINTESDEVSSFLESDLGGTIVSTLIKGFNLEANRRLQDSKIQDALKTKIEETPMYPWQKQVVVDTLQKSEELDMNLVIKEDSARLVIIR